MLTDVAAEEHEPIEVVAGADTDLRTFAQVFEDQRVGALRLAFAMTGDAQLAEDVVAEAFARTFRQWSRGGVREPDAYVRRAVVNEVRTTWRRLEVRRRPAARERPATVPSGIDRVADADLLERALATLPPRVRAVVVLRVVEDLSEQRTAAALGCSVGTVKAYLSGARPVATSSGGDRRRWPWMTSTGGLRTDCASSSARAGDADVWPDTERHLATHQRRRRTMGAAVVAVALVAVSVSRSRSRRAPRSGCAWSRRPRSRPRRADDDRPPAPTTTTTPATTPTTTPVTVQSVTLCPDECVGRATADVDGDGHPDQIGLSANPPLSRDIMAKTAVEACSSASCSPTVASPSTTTLPSGPRRS